MKLRIGFILLMMSFSLARAAGHFWTGTVLSAAQVAQKWGQQSFDALRFKSGDEKVRSAMAHSILINKKNFLGRPVLELKKELGDPDGFYFSDVLPAYLIQRAKSANGESWQIVFLLTKDRRVDEIIVHKNCCY